MFQQPKASVQGGELFLPASATASGNFLGRHTTSADYTVTVKLHAQKSTAAAGVAAIGDEKNTLSAIYQNGIVRIVQLRDGKEMEIANKNVSSSKKPFLRMQVRNGKEIRFFFSSNGKRYSELTLNALDGGYLPPWDRAIRAGVLARGAEGTTAVFDKFEMINE